MSASGKNSKLKYYGISFFRLLFVPKWICRVRRESILKSLNKRADKDYILDRVNYYCKLNQFTPLQETAHAVKDFKRKGHHSVYFFDSYEYVRYFDKNLKWAYTFGDVIDLQNQPSIVKSRPLFNNNQNSVLLNMDKVRHFVFIKDSKPFDKKHNIAIFRGEIDEKPRRIEFMMRWFKSPMCDLGEVGRHTNDIAWKKPTISLYEHLDYKFIISLEGNDVASNLKWVMGSNSIAVMPKPTCETWYMEGRLTPNFHYIEIKADYSDLEERLLYYINNPDEAQMIINNANRWTQQFRDKKRERLISLLVLNKYFKATNKPAL